MTQHYCQRVYNGVVCGKPAVCKGITGWFCAECWDLLQHLLQHVIEEDRSPAKDSPASVGE